MRRPVVVVMSGVTIIVVGVSLRSSRSLASPTAVGTAAIVTGAPSPASVAPVAPPPTTRPPLATHRPAPVHKTRATPRPTHTRVTAAPRRTTAPRPTAAPSVTVNGAAYDTNYGPVQVQITIRSHRIVRADAIVYPNGGDRDREINSYAIPQLDQETLNAQSANIDTVSGATYTSDGYRESLQSALDAAHQAGAL